jgi:hypothetical protein
MVHNGLGGRASNHRLAGISGSNGSRSLKFGQSKDKLAASSVFQAELGRGCCVALRGTYHFDSCSACFFRIGCMYDILRTCEHKKAQLKFIVGSKRLFGACGRLRRARSPSERPGASERTVHRALQERGTLAMSCADAEAPGDSRYTYLMTWRRRFSRPSRMVVICRS